MTFGIVLTTSIVYGEVYKRLQDMTIARLTTALHTQQQLIGNEIISGLTNVEAAVTRPSLIHVLQLIDQQPDNAATLYKLKSIIDSLQHAGFSSAVLRNSDGRKLLNMGTASTRRPEEVVNLKLSNVIKASLYWDHNLILLIVKTVTDNNSVVLGSLEVEIPLFRLTDNLDEIRKIGRTIEFLLCSEKTIELNKLDCFIINHNGLAFQNIPRIANNQPLPISFAFDGVTGNIQTTDYRQTSVVASYAPLEEAALGMVLKIDQKELLDGLYTSVAHLMLFILILLIFWVWLLNYCMKPVILSVITTTDQLAQSEQRLRDFVLHIEQKREEDRKYIAREIHDELGQLISTMQLEVSSLKNNPETSQVGFRLFKLLSKATLATRDVASGLRPASLELGIVPALRALSADVFIRTGVKCHLEFTEDTVDLTEEQAVNIFRIVQECLTNIARYAEASRVDISLFNISDELVVRISDNGKGFNPNEVKAANTFGILGMHERARSIGAQLEIISILQQGTTVNLCLSLPKFKTKTDLS